jgi:eukaryotic-like serine/threonine-protein kinase
MARALRMCLNPRCWALLQEPTSAFGRFVVKHPILSVVLAGLIPNVVTAVFNLMYNMYRFQYDTELQATAKQFWKVVNWVNPIAFSIGIAIGTSAAIKIFRLLQSDKPGEALEGTSRVLKFGQFVALMLLAIWAASGIAFPLSIGEFGSHSFDFYLHFFLSMALCGIAATTYPYMLITALAVRYFVPALVRNGVISGPRRLDLLQTARRNKFFLMTSILAPMLGIWIVVAFVNDQEGMREQKDWALLAVSGGGAAAFLIMIALERLIGLDLAALGHIAIDEPRGGGSTRSSLGRSKRSSR